MEQRNPSMEESRRQRNHKELDEKQKEPPPEFQQHSHHQHRRFLPLMGDNFYNCELCGVRIAVLKIVTTANDQEEQFKVCGTCLKQYIDQEAAKK